MYLVIRMVHKNLRKSHMKNLKVCIASSALVAALALAPASALAEGTTPAPTSTTGATATTGITPIPAPTREQLTDPTVNPYAPEDAYFLPDVTNPIPEGFMVGNADGETIIDNGDGTVTVKGHWVPAMEFDEVINVEFVRIPAPTPNPDPTPAPSPDPLQLQPPIQLQLQHQSQSLLQPLHQHQRRSPYFLQLVSQTLLFQLLFLQ